jgi:hypothetical protein
MRLDKLTKAAVAALEDIKARDIVVLNVVKMTSMFDRVVIASADSTRQTKALQPQEKMKAPAFTAWKASARENGCWWTWVPSCSHMTGHPPVLQPRGLRRATARNRRASDSAALMTRSPVKFIVVAINHRMPAWVDSGFVEYGRMPREARIELSPSSRAAQHQSACSKPRATHFLGAAAGA